MPTIREILEAAALAPVPVVSDLASGGLAIDDAMKGDYGTAALNAAGLIPGIPSLGGVTKISSRFLKPQTREEIAQGFANRFKHPIHTTEGSRFSGFTDPLAQTTLHGYNKNGERFTQRLSDLSPESLSWSRDNNETLQMMLQALRNK